MLHSGDLIGGFLPARREGTAGPHCPLRGCFLTVVGILGVNVPQLHAGNKLLCTVGTCQLCEHHLDSQLSCCSRAMHWGQPIGTVWGGFLGQIPQERGKAASRVELFFWLWPWIRPALQGRGHGQGSLEQAALLKPRASLCGSSAIFISKQALPQLGKHLKGVSGGVSLSRGCSVAPAGLGLASAAAAFPRKS